MEEGLKAAEVRTPFEDETIYYAGQLVAVVIAETFEQARWAARLVHVDYRATAHVLTLDQGKERHAATEMEDERVQRGDAEHALAKCAVHVDRTYVTPCEVHAAMELHSTIARWEEGSLILDDSTQWVFGQPRTLAHVLGIPPRAGPGARAVCRRWLRKQAVPVAALRARGRGIPRDRPTRKIRPAALVSFFVGRAPARDPTARAAWRHGRGKTGRDSPRHRVSHLPGHRVRGKLRRHDGVPLPLSPRRRDPPVDTRERRNPHVDARAGRLSGTLRAGVRTR
jgi:hypothetical protein